MPAFDLYRRLENLEKEMRYLRQQQLLCHHHHRSNHLKQRTPAHHPKHDVTYLARNVTGHVKWFNVKQGYGFITRDDSSDDVFVYKFGISKNNPSKLFPSVGDGEMVEFDVILVTGRTPEAVNVTGPNGACVLGSDYSPDIVPCHNQANLCDTESPEIVTTAILSEPSLLLDSNHDDSDDDLKEVEATVKLPDNNGNGEINDHDNMCYDEELELCSDSESSDFECSESESCIVSQSHVEEGQIDAFQQKLSQLHQQVYPEMTDDIIDDQPLTGLRLSSRQSKPPDNLMYSTLGNFLQRADTLLTNAAYQLIQHVDNLPIQPYD